MSKTFEIDNQQFDVEFFDVDTIDPNSCILVLGKKNSGKTTDTIFMLKTIHPDQKGYIVTDEVSVEMYKKELPSADIVTELSLVDLNSVRNDGSYAYIVLDCILNLYSYTDAIKRVFDSIKQTRVVVQQFPYNMNKSLQNKIDYIFIHNDCFHTNHTRIYQYYANFIEKFNTFQQLMKRLTMNNDAMVICKCDNNKVFWFNCRTKKLKIDGDNEETNDFQVEKSSTETVIYPDFIDNTVYKEDSGDAEPNDNGGCAIL